MKLKRIIGHFKAQLSLTQKKYCSQQIIYGIKIPLVKKEQNDEKKILIRSKIDLIYKLVSEKVEMRMIEGYWWANKRDSRKNINSKTILYLKKTNMLQINEYTVKALVGNSYFIEELQNQINEAVSQKFRENLHQSNNQICMMDEIANQISEELKMHIAQEAQKLKEKFEEEMLHRHNAIFELKLNQIKTIKEEIYENIREDSFLKTYFNQIKRLSAENKRILSESLMMEFSCIEGNNKFIEEENQLFLSSNMENNTTQLVQWFDSKNIKNRLQQFETQLKTIIEQNTKWNVEMSQKIQATYGKMVFVREQLSERIETMFGSLWTVLGNIENRLFQYEKFFKKIR